MRKHRNYDAELKALADRAKQLRGRKLTQLGELVAATAADTLPIEMLAGALLSAAETKDASTQEAWRKRGTAFFSGAAGSRSGACGNTSRAAPDGGGTAPPTGQDRA